MVCRVLLHRNNEIIQSLMLMCLWLVCSHPPMVERRTRSRTRAQSKLTPWLICFLSNFKRWLVRASRHRPVVWRWIKQQSHTQTTTDTYTRTCTAAAGCVWPVIPTKGSTPRQDASQRGRDPQPRTIHACSRTALLLHHE